MSSNSSSLASLCALPSEILWKIILLLNPVDRSNARLVSKQLNKYCDHPKHWTNLLLDPFIIAPIIHSSSSTRNSITVVSRNSNDVLPLWYLEDLKNVLEPHLALIRTMQILGVRDNIVRYIILHCHNLQELTISGWSTLSDHALRIPNQQLPLRRLRLVGQQRSNFTSLDAATFGKLITQCPQLEELSVVSCQIHIQADSFIKSFDPASRQDQQDQQQQQLNNIPPPNSGTVGDTALSSPAGDSSQTLKSLTIATKRTWSIQHVTRLFQLCPSLQVLALVPDSKNSVVENTSPDSPTTPIPVLNDNHSLLEKNIQSIEEGEMLEFDNILTYSL